MQYDRTHIENVLLVSSSWANKSNVCAAGILSVFTKYGFVVSKRDLLIPVEVAYNQFAENSLCYFKILSETYRYANIVCFELTGVLLLNPGIDTISTSSNCNICG